MIDYTYIRCMEKKKRKGRTYKIADGPYYEALRRGFGNSDMPLARLIEKVATLYGEGYGISYVTPAGAHGVIVERKKSKRLRNIHQE